MVKLLALRKWCELSGITAEDASKLCLGNPDYVDLFDALPHIYPTNNWFQLRECQLKSGIKAEAFCLREGEDQKYIQNHRIKISKIAPDAAFRDQTKCRHSYDWYSNTAKLFWFSVLSPLQLEAYYPGDFNIDVQFWVVAKMARDTPLMKICYTNPQWVECLTALRSMPKIRPGWLQLVDAPYHRRFFKMMGLSAKNTPWNFPVPSEDKIKIWEQVKDKYVVQIAEIYELIMKCQCYGICNDKLMEVY